MTVCINDNRNLDRNTMLSAGTIRFERPHRITRGKEV